MQDVMKEYGPAIITVIAIIVLIGVIAAVINAVAPEVFSNLLTGFFQDAKDAKDGATTSAQTSVAPITGG